MGAWRIDCVKDGERWPLITDVPSESEAEALVSVFGHRTDAWDELVAVFVEDSETIPDPGIFAKLRKEVSR
jgi:hypothetical protein